MDLQNATCVALWNSPGALWKPGALIIHLWAEKMFRKESGQNNVYARIFLLEWQYHVCFQDHFVSALLDPKEEFKSEKQKSLHYIGQII